MFEKIPKRDLGVAGILVIGGVSLTGCNKPSDRPAPKNTPSAISFSVDRVVYNTDKTIRRIETTTPILQSNVTGVERINIYPTCINSADPSDIIVEHRADLRISPGRFESVRISPNDDVCIDRVVTGKEVSAVLQTFTDSLRP